jgi:hypothetical protein
VVDFSSGDGVDDDNDDDGGFCVPYEQDICLTADIICLKKVLFHRVDVCSFHSVHQQD